jgi:hypothetical protein
MVLDWLAYLGVSMETQLIFWGVVVVVVIGVVWFLNRKKKK